MNIGGPRFGWAVRMGRGLWYDEMLSITVGIGFQKDASIGEIPWRHYWRWSSRSLPRLIFRQVWWRDTRLVYPCGFQAFGRSRIYF